jgi:microcystin-dependent protein
MSFGFPPKGWALCNGQLLPINQNQALFSLLGTTYGGNGQTNFALPDLRGKVPMHFGGGHTLGETAGQTAHTITMSEMPAHNHLVSTTNVNATQVSPASGQFASALNVYRGFDQATTMTPASLSSVGGSQPHENRQPILALNFCIALQGIFPSQN